MVLVLVLLVVLVLVLLVVVAGACGVGAAGKAPSLVSASEREGQAAPPTLRVSDAVRHRLTAIVSQTPTTRTGFSFCRLRAQASPRSPCSPQLPYPPQKAATTTPDDQEMAAAKQVETRGVRTMKHHEAPHRRSLPHTPSLFPPPPPSPLPHIVLTTLQWGGKAADRVFAIMVKP